MSETVEMHVEGHVEAIKGWLASYRDDVLEIRRAMLSEAPSPRARQTLAGVLSYQLRKMDLTPDWTPEIGMVDDAMVLRTGAAVFKINNLLELPSDVEETIERLSGEDAVVRAILGERYDDFFQRVRGLVEQRIHGRVPEEIIEDRAKRDELLADLDRFLDAYHPAAIKDPEGFYFELLSYLGAKL